jgi:hypothetical protein
MTTLNWEKLPRGRIGDTVWSTPLVGDVLGHDQKRLRINAERLETLFCSREPPPSRLNSRRPSAPGGAPGDERLPNSSKVMLLDAKRATNVGIMITQLKRPIRRPTGGAASAQHRGRSGGGGGASGSVFGRYEEIPCEELRDAILEANTTTGPFAVDLDAADTSGGDIAEAHEQEKQRVLAVAKQVLEIVPTPEEVRVAWAALRRRLGRARQGHGLRRSSQRQGLRCCALRGSAMAALP